MAVHQSIVLSTFVSVRLIVDERDMHVVHLSCVI